jgi:dTDP-4-dehydrorhamnose reductase
MKELDIRDPDAVSRRLRSESPGVVINCAAFTNVDGAETSPDEAMAANGVAPGVIAAACDAIAARMVHISTDYVFDGASGSPYPTDAIPAPANVYGATKLEGERRVLAASHRSVVIRTAWVHSCRGTNFVKTAVRILGSAATMRVVDDQIGTPTRARHLAAALWRAAENESLPQLLHFTDAGVASWYDVAVAVMDTMAKAGRLPAGASVEPTRSSDRPAAARRPASAILAKHDSWGALGYRPPHWSVGVAASTMEILNA